MEEPGNINPDHPIVPTDDPGATEAQYAAQGFVLCNLYVGRFYPALAQGRQWACQFWRPEVPAQRDLL